jgi:hypothetical protein
LTEKIKNINIEWDGFEYSHHVPELINNKQYDIANEL